MLVVIGIVEAARTRVVLYRQANRVRTANVTGFIADVFEAVQGCSLKRRDDSVSQIRQWPTLTDAVHQLRRQRPRPR